MTNYQLAIAFFLQLAVILTVCRLVGYAAKFLGQPQVVGEMIAGVLLGPSLFGLMAPELSEVVFPKATMPALYIAAQIGLVLYMFTVGLEFRLDLVAKSGRAAASISIAGMAAPFALGAAIAYAILADRGLFKEGVGANSAMLFMGAAMSITAFPMLARIISERGLAGTRIGALALAAGSIDDATAWCVLAIVLAQLGGDPTTAYMAIGGGVAYAAFALLVLRRILPRVLKVDQNGQLGPSTIGAVLALLMLGAWFTDWIGIYAVFGAFLLGAAIPRGAVADSLARLIGPLTTALFLPLFFVYSGLNTRLTLLDSTSVWGLAAVVLLAACLGKGVACWAAARLHGESGPDATAIGALMNSRGLMELIILNIGLERGVITGTLFSIMVLMAVVTTLLATPIFEAALRRRTAQDTQTAPAA